MDKNSQACFFSAEQIKQLKDEFSTVEEKYKKLLIKYTTLQLSNAEAYEYAYHGFTRRLGTLKRCMQNIYALCPPDRAKSDKPSRDECLDLGINLQSFVFNVFGCLDNLAWIWAKERQLKDDKGKLLDKNKISLMSKDKNKIIRQSFSQEFQNYLDTLQEKKDRPKSWHENLEDFRHALAHRIPLYVPPFAITPEDQEKSDRLEKQMREELKKHNFQEFDRLNAEQDSLGFFLPCMSHSFSENSPRVVFYSQILDDWNTIAEISEKFIEELSKAKD